MDRIMRGQRLAELDAQREALEHRVEEIEAQRAELHRLLRENERNRAVFAPVHLLPDDVLKLILEAAYEHTLLEECTEESSLPMVATHVSSRWRQVALSLPRLWRCIHIGRSTQLLEHHLKHSGSLTLFLCCVAPESLKDQPWTSLSTDNDSWRERYTQQLTRIIDYAYRFIHIYMVTTSGRFMEDMLPIMQRASFPLLKGLVLLNCTGSPLPETARFSLDCPRLTGLAYLHAPVFFFPLAALEDLDLNRPSPELSLQTLCALAEAAPRLRTLKINWTKPAPRSEGNAAHFPRLGTLAIKDCHYPETILDCIDAPALSTLSLDECLLSRPPASPSEQRTIRSFPAVHTLRLRQYTPAIKVLELGRWCQLHMTAVVTHFAWMKPIPFRSLHTLQVSGPANYVFVHLSKILTQRMQGELPLVELSLSERMRGNLSVEQMEMLEDLVNITSFSPDLEPGEDYDTEVDARKSALALKRPDEASSGRFQGSQTLSGRLASAHSRGAFSDAGHKLPTAAPLFYDVMVSHLWTYRP